MKQLTTTLLLACLGMSACKARNAYEKPALPVTAETAISEVGEAGIRFSANVEPHTRLDLAFKVPGYVSEIATRPGVSGEPRILQEGDFVHKGEVLARLQLAEYGEKSKQASSQIQEASAMLVQAKADFDRASQLFSSGSLTKPEYDAAKARYESILAKLNGANAMKGEADEYVGYTVLRAPMDGVILKRTVERGTFVGPGMPAFILGDTKRVKVVFAVPDKTVETLKLGTQIGITMQSLPERRFQGPITRVSPSADSYSRNFEVEVTLDNRSGELRSGMIASLSLDGAREQSNSPAFVPLAAIVRPPGRSTGYAIYTVETVGGRSVARLREIKPQHPAGNWMSAEGVKPGESVIINGATVVFDGRPVRVIH